MTVDWANFTPWTALLGGLLIGAASSAMWLLSGRVLGVSGIAGGLLQPRTQDTAWRIWFIAGLLVPPLALKMSGAMMTPQFAGPIAVVALAGLLVGFGSRLGSGCTSGHGICGLARLSRRSIVATLCFMLTGFLTVYLVRHVL